MYMGVNLCLNNFVDVHMALVAIIHETISGSTAYHLQQLVTFRESISWFQFKCANGWTYSLIYKCVNVNAAVNGL